MSSALVHRKTLDLETFSRAVGIHPDLVRRLVALGLLEPAPEPGGLSFDRDQLGAAARIRRLHERLALNYAAIGLVMDLLDRIADLERLGRAPSSTGGRPWN
jgi:hypothetical protein